MTFCPSTDSSSPVAFSALLGPACVIGWRGNLPPRGVSMKEILLLVVDAIEQISVDVAATRAILGDTIGPWKLDKELFAAREVSRAVILPVLAPLRKAVESLPDGTV